MGAREWTRESESFTALALAASSAGGGLMRTVPIYERSAFSALFREYGFTAFPLSALPLSTRFVESDLRALLDGTSLKEPTAQKASSKDKGRAKGRKGGKKKS